ncbi:MAG: gamma-glutamyl-gamma-aminobutyrate hydrolase family protein [Thermodesulfovibrionales bacterium]|nr:gamma-glutamyl-gamma-aminobutyrate hydrolase family protein [Thermodesulfovibrionales bacterium]
MHPIIGITTDIEKNKFTVKSDYVKAIASYGGIPQLITPIDKSFYMDINVSLVANNIQGLLLTGGGDIPPKYYKEKLTIPKKKFKPLSNIRVDFELKLIKELIILKKPLLGICLGMQILNIALGGSLYQDIKFQCRSKINHEKEDHFVYIIDGSRLNLSNNRYLVNSTHHQAIKKLGKGLCIFAHSDDNIIEGFYKKDYPFLVGVQWHLERIPFDELSCKILSLFIERSKNND